MHEVSSPTTICSQFCVIKYFKVKSLSVYVAYINLVLEMDICMRYKSPVNHVRIGRFVYLEIRERNIFTNQLECPHLPNHNFLNFNTLKVA